MKVFTQSRRWRSLLSAGVLIVANPLGNWFDRQSSNKTQAVKESFQSLDDILRYISADWDNLKRSMADCESFEDIKTSGDEALYIPADIAAPSGLEEALKQCNVRVLRLPKKITEEAVGEIRPHGLLYLENPYVVPGGQFNEMYGWDSYFIIRGLLRDHHRDLARGMVENFFYEIQHYGGVLNANRTYYLGRSQPPFLSSMILALYNSDHAAGQSNLSWLEKAYPFAVEDYEQWNRKPHLAGDTGLSRYYDEGEGPVPEIMGDPSDYYRGVARFFLVKGGESDPHLVKVDTRHSDASVLGPVFQVSICDSAPIRIHTANCAPADGIALSAEFYKGDRSMRESGFDVTFRFGPYGAETHHFAPVCLNSLLYKTERDLGQIAVLLGRESDAEQWAKKAVERKRRITKYLWDERRGLFVDYNFTTHARSSYEYATTFYPLWAGLASVEQAHAVDRNLHLFEQPGGLAMSRHESEAQWDFPYGWAPIHLLAMEGLRRYGYRSDANRNTEKFLSMVLENFRNDHTLREKYNVVRRSAETHIAAGYAQNVTGFGWTNAVFVELLRESPPDLAARLSKE